jgi:hypothetical protein
MVELIGSIQNTKVENGQLVDEWSIPALSETMARRRVRANARLKNREGTSIQSLEKVRSGSIPGQTIYKITTVSSR